MISVHLENFITPCSLTIWRNINKSYTRSSFMDFISVFITSSHLLDSKFEIANWQQSEGFIIKKFNIRYDKSKFLCLLINYTIHVNTFCFIKFLINYLNSLKKLLLIASLKSKAFSLWFLNFFKVHISSTRNLVSKNSSFEMNITMFLVGLQKLYLKQSFRIFYINALSRCQVEFKLLGLHNLHNYVPFIY